MTILFLLGLQSRGKKKRAHIKQVREKQTILWSRRPRAKKRYVDHIAGHAKILRLYCGKDAKKDAQGNFIQPAVPPVFNEIKFRRRWRISRRLAEKIHADIRHPIHGCKYFNLGPERNGKRGLSSLQKLFAALRILCYGTCADLLEDSFDISETTARISHYNFCDWATKYYASTIMGEWKEADLQREMDHNATRDFPGMIGSIDCTHWVWKNGPVSWQGHKRSVVMEAIAGHDLYFSHVFVGMPGSCNDINVLQRSSIKIKIKYLGGPARTIKYELNGKQKEGGHILTDGIYPDYTYFVKSIRRPIFPKDRMFAGEQEGARKDVECAFGRKLIKFGILQKPALVWRLRTLKNMCKSCAILHNLTIRDLQAAEEPAENLRRHPPEKALRRAR